MPSPTVLSFLRRFAVALLVVVVIAAVGLVLADKFARDKFASSRHIHVPNLVPAYPGQPANYLLIGSDTREGADAQFGSPDQTPGKRSDVMMVLHVEPKARTGMLVSFPRDLVVNIPGHGRNLLNAAFELGGDNGPALTIQTLEDNFPPLKINHYIEVDFKGFESIVDAIGKIHLWFPTPAHDPYSGLNINRSGCVAVSGVSALAYARSRHYYIPKDPKHPAVWQWDYSTSIPEDAFRGGRGWTATGSDLDRIPRQQYFLRTVSQAAIDKTAADPRKLVGLLDAMSENFTHDDTLKYDELKALVRTFNRLNPARVDMETLPVTQAPYPGYSAHVIATDAANSIIGRLMNFGTSPALPDLIAPAKVNVRIVNGSGVKGAEVPVIALFKTAGFHVLTTQGVADRTDYVRTQIRYAPGKFPEGFTVATAVNTLNLVPAISDQNTLNADVLVIVGRDYDALRHKFPGPKPSTTGSTKPGAKTSTSQPTAPSPPKSTSTSTAPKPANVDSRFVPVDPKTGGTLVGCPT